MSKKMLIPLAAAVAVLAVIGAVLFWQSDDQSPSAQDSPDRGVADEAPEPEQELAPVPIDGYQATGPDELTLTYSIGVPECYGVLGDPTVVETEDAVQVALGRIEPDPDPDRMCIQVVETKTVVVPLSQPLGDREVRDANQDGAVVPGR